MTYEFLWFEGLPFPDFGYIIEGIKEGCTMFVIKDEDTIMVSYPKSVPYGSWFEHIRGWMSMRHRENVLLLSYEELQKNPRSTIEKICQFLGKKLNLEELDSVLKNSSFHSMKQNKMSNLETMPESLTSLHFSMARKGICGDWKNHFTVAQDEAFNKVFKEKLAGFPKDLFPWE
ncbi:3-alpha-hydroxysteroid sulfotransferase [Sciurus carolinensis]|uniref:Sulfotransferase n=1 Tax=Sciurus carolinensis TaxID=30640 RepID=A0AA41NF34_SCICA|nr:3-alpha-hydroxysteroid sulfotransferase [Sciurus carolinensis]